MFLRGDSVIMVLKNPLATTDIRVELSKQAIHLVKTIKLKEKSAKMLKAAFYKIQTEFGTEIFVGSDLSTSDTVWN
uniref:Uncharacterized protein n=1 Tax=Ditylenchus dipsaci TaxID=166011 RepID=A0A915ERF3_9BILA